MARLGESEVLLDASGRTGATGGTYDGPALRALAEAYLAQKIAIRDDNPYGRELRDEVRGAGLAGPYSEFAKLSLGQRVNTALRYQGLADNAEKVAPGPASRFSRLATQRMRGGTMQVGGGA